MYYFIVNPRSRSGNGKYVWQQAERILEQEDTEYRVYFTAYRFHATELAAEITSRPERLTLIAVGGDGTVNEVLNGIRDFSRVIFGYIPTGSSNDFARCLGLPVDTAAAVQNILHPSCFDKIDLGQVELNHQKRYFAVSCGCGFDAAVCHEAHDSRIKRILNHLHLGKLTYAGIALKQLLLCHPAPVSVTLDNGKSLTFSRAYFVSGMNCFCEGGGLRMAPRADVHDGFLDIFVVNRLSKLLIALMLPTAYIGLHTIFPGVHIYRTRAAEVTVHGTLSLHVDGETRLMKGTVKMTCHPQALTLLAAGKNP